MADLLSPCWDEIMSWSIFLCLVAYTCCKWEESCFSPVRLLLTLVHIPVVLGSERNITTNSPDAFLLPDHSSASVLNDEDIRDCPVRNQPIGQVIYFYQCVCVFKLASSYRSDYDRRRGGCQVTQCEEGRSSLGWGWRRWIQLTKHRTLVFISRMKPVVIIVSFNNALRTTIITVTMTPKLPLTRTVYECS